jgi:WD40 repeat protein
MIISDDDNDTLKQSVSLEEVKSFHFKGAVETLCFTKNGSVLILYERDTSYLTYIDLIDGFKLSTYSINGDVCGGFDGHVSFAVLQLALSPDGKYICAATDASRNIVMEVGSSNIVRDLYGHKNDSFSNPRVAWSQNGQYIFGNTQEDCSLLVWDVASSKIVKALKGHDGQLRDIYSSKSSDIVVTASFDKSCRVWLNEM